MKSGICIITQSGFPIKWPTWNPKSLLRYLKRAENMGHWWFLLAGAQFHLWTTDVSLRSRGTLLMQRSCATRKGFDLRLSDSVPPKATFPCPCLRFRFPLTDPGHTSFLLSIMGSNWLQNRWIHYLARLYFKGKLTQMEPTHGKALSLWYMIQFWWKCRQRRGHGNVALFLRWHKVCQYSCQDVHCSIVLTHTWCCSSNFKLKLCRTQLL